MSWAAVLSGLLKLANMLASFMHDKALMEAGEAKATLAGIRSAQDAMQRAMAARDAVRDELEREPTKLRDDDCFKREP